MAVNKSGIFFTVDALLASSILLTTILLLSAVYTSDKPTVFLNYQSEDIINALGSLKVAELDNSYVDELILNKNITNLNNSVLEQIGEFWAFKKFAIAEKFIKNITDNMLPEKTGFGIWVNNELIYNKSAMESDSSVSVKSLISGYEKDKPVLGSSSRVYLQSIGTKKSNAFAYFGGFVGQGNLFRQLNLIPEDATLNYALIEADVGGNFSIYINDVSCNSFEPNILENMTAEIFNISDCLSLFDKGIKNNISINFSGDISNAYLAGGLVKVGYSTSQFGENFSNSNLRYYFPGIDGISNLFSSFYVPGTLNSMHVYLHFKSNFSTYLTIGDRTVFSNNGSITPEQTIDIGNQTLTDFPILLDFETLNRTTVPIRFASYNNTVETILEGGNADVVLITDLSGSMKLRMNSWSQPGNAIPNCRESDITDPTSRRLGVAACLDSEFNAIVMNYTFTGNRLFLVDFSTNANPFYTNNLPDLTKENIESEIVSRYKSKNQNEISGWTCLACAINLAYDILKNYSDSSRVKSVLVMSDGIPTHCTGGYWDGFTYFCNETSVGTNGKGMFGTSFIPWCSGDEDACDTSDCDGPINNSINAAIRLNSDLNATISAVGFGPIDNCYNANYTLNKIAEAGNGSFAIGENASKLQNFYRDFAYSILASVNKSSQTLIVPGNITISKLYPDSYIEINYTSNVPEPVFGDIVFSFQSEPFSNCTYNVTIPAKVKILEATVTSYSGIHWTKSVIVNGQTVFNLSDYHYYYDRLGDPYNIFIPPNLLVAGNNTIAIATGDNSINDTGCSKNNSLIYKGAVPISTQYSEILSKSEGCNWTIEREDSVLFNMLIPSDYSNAKECNYTSSSIVYDNDDSIDSAVYNLLLNLDFDENGKIDVFIDEEDLTLDAVSVTDLPSLWGPAILEVKVWQ